MTVRKHALLPEFTILSLHESATQLRLVVDAEVLDVLEHLLARGKVHHFLLPLVLLLVRQTKALLH